MEAKSKSAKCAYCKSWGVDVPANICKTASWLKCEIPLPICDMPVREWLFDEEAQKHKWMQTGDMDEGTGGGKCVVAHRDYCCNHFERRRTH
jgi:hypothetical protein